MKQSKTLRRISVAVVAVLLITMSVLSVTLAKYASVVTTTGTMDAASYEVNLKDGSDVEYLDTFAIAPTGYTNLASGKIAPGTKGSFTIKVENAGEVDILYHLNLKATSDNTIPSSITFKLGSESGTDITDDIKGTNGYTKEDGSIAFDAATKVDTITIYWNWAYGEAGPITSVSQADQTDTNFADKTISIAVNLYAWQEAPATAA